MLKNIIVEIFISFLISVAIWAVIFSDILLSQKLLCITLNALFYLSIIIFQLFRKEILDERISVAEHNRSNNHNKKCIVLSNSFADYMIVASVGILFMFWAKYIGILKQFGIDLSDFSTLLAIVLSIDKVKNYVKETEKNRKS